MVTADAETPISNCSAVTQSYGSDFAIYEMKSVTDGGISTKVEALEADLFELDRQRLKHCCITVFR